MRKILSVLSIAALGLGVTAVVGTSASATTQCPLNSHSMCVFTGDSYTGSEWDFTPLVCFTPGYVKYLPSSFRNAVNSATNSDDGNQWSLYNERSGVYSDTLLVRLPYGSSISHLSSSNTADYMKAG